MPDDNDDESWTSVHLYYATRRSHPRKVTRITSKHTRCTALVGIIRISAAGQLGKLTVWLGVCGLAPPGRAQTNISLPQYQ
jgi:hypothetical protein